MNKYYPVETFDHKYFSYEQESMTVIPIDFEQYQCLTAPDDSNRFKELIQDLDEAVKSNPKGSYISEFTASDRVLRSIVLPITKACNLACPYCFAKSNKVPNHTKDFTDEDIDSIVKFINSSNAGEHFNLIFFGGEPLVRFDLIKKTVETTINNISNHTVSFSITTNGTLLTDRIAEFFSVNKFAVLLSLDGLDNKYNHRVFKNGKPSFNKALRGYNLLKAHNVITEIRATLTKDNPYIFDTYEYFENLKVPFTVAFAYESENKAGKEFSSFNDEDIANISTSLDALERYYAHKIENNEIIYNSVFSKLAQKLELRIRQESACAGGFSYFTLMHGGEIFSCPHLMDDNEYRMGNINDFQKMKQNDYDFTPISVNKIGSCSDCWAKFLCSGGCTSQKISLGRKNFEPLSEERCKLEKVLFTHDLRLYYHLKTKSGQKSQSV